MQSSWFERRHSVWLVALGVFLAASTSSAYAPITGDLFDRYEIGLGGAGKHQTVLPGFFLGGPIAELAVLGADENGDRHLRLFAFGGARDGAGAAWEQTIETTLGPDIAFVDVINIGGRDRLITFERGRVNWFDPGSQTRRPLVEIATDYRSTHDLEGTPAQPGGDPPRVDITRDLNHDGRDDLIVPDVDGFWISIQRSDASFTEAVKLGPPEPLRDELVGNLNPGGGASDPALTYGDLGITASTLPLYLSRVHEMDYDLDGRSDLVFWNQDHFEVHLQDENGLFAPVAETFVPGVPFDSEGVYSRAFDFRGQGLFSVLFGFGKKTEGTVLHSLRDLDGDGVADLVTLTLSGRSATRQRSVYDVHFGTVTAGGTVFEPDAGAVIRPRGRGGAMQPWGYSVQRFEDLDGDGQAESMFREVTVGLVGMARALVGNSVPINVELYRMEGGVYGESPSFMRQIRRFAPFAGLGNVFFPPVLIGDVNGDGRSDLLVGQNPKQLHVFFGVAGPDLFARRPLKVPVALPPDERNTWLADLNGDGKQDVLVNRGPTSHAPAEPHRLTILIAR